MNELNKLRVRVCVPLAAASLLGGCLMGPNYVRPPAPVTAEFKEAGNWKTAQPNDGATRGKWWEVFGDAKLNELADQVNISNENVRAAEARLRQAEALVEQSRSGLWPTQSIVTLYSLWGGAGGSGGGGFGASEQPASTAAAKAANHWPFSVT